MNANWNLKFDIRNYFYGGTTTNNTKRSGSGSCNAGENRNCRNAVVSEKRAAGF